MELNKYPGSNGLQRGDQHIVEQYYPDADHIFLLFRREDHQAFGIFDLRELAEEKSEMSAYIRNSFEMDRSVFIDFFPGLRMNTLYEQQQSLYGMGKKRPCLHHWASNPLTGFVLLRSL